MNKVINSHRQELANTYALGHKCDLRQGEQPWALLALPCNSVTHLLAVEGKHDSRLECGLIDKVADCRYLWPQLNIHWKMLLKAIAKVIHICVDKNDNEVQITNWRLTSSDRQTLQTEAETPCMLTRKVALLASVHVHGQSPRAIPSQAHRVGIIAQPVQARTCMQVYA